jgi:hypothetical protein
MNIQGYIDVTPDNPHILPTLLLMGYSFLSYVRPKAPIYRIYLGYGDSKINYTTKLDRQTLLEDITQWFIDTWVKCRDKFFMPCSIDYTEQNVSILKSLGYNVHLLKNRYDCIRVSGGQRVFYTFSRDKDIPDANSAFLELYSTPSSSILRKVNNVKVRSFNP